MIISHRHKFIFLKTNKTAGTSIEIALSKFCGPDDVIAPIVPRDELIRKNLGYPGPQNHLAPWWSYGPKDIARLLVKRRKKMRFRDHTPAREVRRQLGSQLWREYFKFCFERNPWDRVISFYYWRCRREPRPPISEFIRSPIVEALKLRGFDVYTMDGRIAVDRVCRFENLEEELEAVRLRVGIPEKLGLPRAKAQFRMDRRSYREVLGPEDAARIAKLFSDEIRLFGYEF